MAILQLGGEADFTPPQLATEDRPGPLQTRRTQMRLPQVASKTQPLIPRRPFCFERGDIPSHLTLTRQHMASYLTTKASRSHSLVHCNRSISRALLRVPLGQSSNFLGSLAPVHTGRACARCGPRAPRHGASHLRSPGQLGGIGTSPVGRCDRFASSGRGGRDCYGAEAVTLLFQCSDVLGKFKQDST